MMVGTHPETAANSKLKSLFEKVGCSGYPYNIDKVPSGAADLKTLYSAGQEDAVQKSLLNLKSMANKYLAGDTAADNKTASDMCYGDARMIGSAQMGTQDCPLQANCLPTARFSCPSQSTVNDFGIRTHRDFHQATSYLD